MTPTTALPIQSPADALARRTLQNSGSGAGEGQGDKFPELLGQLLGDAAPENPEKSKVTNLADRTAENDGGPPLPWKFRLPSTATAKIAAAAAAGRELPSQISPAELSTVQEGLPRGAGEAVAELLPDVQSQLPGEEILPEDVLVAPANDLIAEPADRPFAGANALLMSAREPVASNSRASPALPASDTGVAPGSEERRRRSSPVEVRMSFAQRPEPRDAMATMSVGESEGTFTVGASWAVEGGTQDKDTVPTVLGQSRVSVLRTETHLPPVPHAPPMHQIAERVNAELVALETGDIGADGLSTPRAGSRPDAAVKVLHIQLQPAELGTVTVRMSLKRDILEVQLDVSRQDTAHIVRQDRDVLSKILQSAGYALDGLTVHVVEPDRGALNLQHGSQGNTAGGQSQLQSQPQGSTGDGRASDMQQHTGREGRHPPAASHDAASAGSDAPRTQTSPGGVYL